MQWEVVVPVTVAVLGPIITWVGARIAFSRDTTSKTMDVIMQRLNKIEAENELLRNRVNELETQILEAKRRENTLINQLAQIEGKHFDLPFPMWIKDRELRMAAANPAYEQTFLKPLGKKLDDYLGRDDSAIWNEEIATQFRYHDNYVLSSGNVWSGVEHVPIGDTPARPFRIIKFPRYGSGGVMVGIAGMAIALEEL